MRLFGYLAILPAALLMGCAQMTVKVSILQSNKLQQTTGWIENDVLSRQSAAIALFGGSTSDDLSNNESDPHLRRKAHAAFLTIEDQLKQLQLAINSVLKKPNSQEILKYYEQTINDAYEKAASFYQQGIVATKLAERTETDEGKRDKLLAAKLAFDNGDSAILALNQQLQDELNGPSIALLEKIYATAATTEPADGPKESPDVAAEINTNASEVAAAVAPIVPQLTTTLPALAAETDQSLIGKASILDDRHAAEVVSADDSYWTGEPNKCYAGGGLGDTDIAVREMGLGTFTLKGVRVDSTKITQATFDSIKMSVQLVAAAYGVPLPSGGSSSAGSNAQTTNTTPPAATITNGTTTSVIQQQRLAVLAILQAVADEGADIETTPANATKDLAQVQNVFNAYKPALSAGAASKN